MGPSAQVQQVRLPSKNENPPHFEWQADSTQLLFALDQSLGVIDLSTWTLKMIRKKLKGYPSVLGVSEGMGLYEYQHKIHAIDLKTGKERWGRETQGAFSADFSIQPGKGKVAIDQLGGVEVLELHSGKLLQSWKYDNIDLHKGFQLSKGDGAGLVRDSPNIQIGKFRIAFWRCPAHASRDRDRAPAVAALTGAPHIRRSGFCPHTGSLGSDPSPKPLRSKPRT